MIWPKRPGSWNYGAVKAREAFKNVAHAIAESEDVYMLAEPDVAEDARRALGVTGEAAAETPGTGARIHVLEMGSDDAWARDVGPTFVKNRAGDVRGIDWEFNAWGGTVDGLYAHWEKDDQVAERFCEALGYECYEACLLSAGRNPELTKEEIEERLLSYLGGKKVIWLPRGIYNDETNEHVDNICAFTAPGHVVLAWTDDEADPQYELSMACLKALEASVDACGRRLQVHKLPIPKTPICVTEEDLKGYEFEPGEDVREAGERLAASYVNFYISNGGVVVPQFGDENDETAVRILAELFPGRRLPTSFRSSA